MTLPAALSSLAAFHQFIVCLLVPLPDGKTDKIPCCAKTGKRGINSQDPQFWVSADEAYRAAASRPDYRAAFVITDADPFFCLDMDGALLPDGNWSPMVNEVLAAVPTVGVEVSQSGKGVHLWGTYSGAMPDHMCKPPAAIRAKLPIDLELYNRGRFICLGQPGATGAIADCTAYLPAVIARWFPAAAVTPPTYAATRNPAWRGPEDDDELIRRMHASRPSFNSMLGGSAKFTDLWVNNLDALTPVFTVNGDYDESRADASLAIHLAWWTGCDAERMERLMRRSGLNRPKYDREDYLPLRTIPDAIAKTGDKCYIETPKDALPEVEVPPGVDGAQLPSARVVAGHTILFPDEQAKMWEGFVYVAEGDYILAPNGIPRNQAKFKGKFNGWSFVMDNDNAAKPSKNAWEAFIDTQALRHPKVDRASFRPDLPFRHIWEEEGATYVNSYTPVKIPRVKGDPAPFLRHIEKLLDDPRDREILIAFLCGLVQYQGHKFQWAVFMQGHTGCGKSLLTECVIRAIGMKHSHKAKTRGMFEDKNEFLRGITFLCVPDVHHSFHSGEMEEEMKPMITDEWQAIRAMGVAQRMERVCYNIIFEGNDKSAIRKDETDRRIVPFFMRQQTMAHLERDGMNAEYFRGFVDWLENQHGYAIVAEFLHTHKLADEFGLGWFKGRAPITSSTPEAIAASKGRVEQEIEEAIASERYGFCGGWIATSEVTALLRECHLNLPRARYAAVMRSLGYIKHPHLHNDSRLTSGPKVVVYVKEGHPNNGYVKDITKAYEDAQSKATFNCFDGRKGVAA